jgi:hypothetical protein
VGGSVVNVTQSFVFRRLRYVPIQIDHWTGVPREVDVRKPDARLCANSVAATTYWYLVPGIALEPWPPQRHREMDNAISHAVGATRDGQRNLPRRRCDKTRKLPGTPQVTHARTQRKESAQMTTRMEKPDSLYVGCTIKEMRERSRWMLKWSFVLLLFLEGRKTSSCSRLSFTVQGARARIGGTCVELAWGFVGACERVRRVCTNGIDA